MEFKVKIGDKVKIPKTKSVESSYEDSGAITSAKKRRQDFLYYMGPSRTPQRHMLWYKFDSNNLSGDHFLEHEIEPYEEEFPEKWCLKINQENQKTVGEWFLKRFDNHKDISTHSGYWTNYFCFPITDDRGFPSVSQVKIPNDYTEITFDQFKKHILKEPEETMKNLFETEFVIKNCTLSQRLAIKAYCDEKKIKYFKDSFEIIYGRHLTFDSKGDGFVGTTSLEDKDKITFSELIQFLDQYQPEPEFKVGDIVVLEKKSKGEMSVKNGMLAKITALNSYLHLEWLSDTTQMNGGYNYEDFRHATPEEIKKWKKENEIKLSVIGGYDGRAGKIGYLKWGCTEISVSTIKELLELGLTHINFTGDKEVDYKQIEQIKKFIEHNKL